MKRIVLIFFLLRVGLTVAQIQADTLTTLSVEQFMSWVITNHPIAKQAALLPEVAQQELRMAKGSFDPKLDAVLESKEFQDKSYYAKADAYLSVPTRSPITPKIGFEQNKGELLNEIDKIPGDRQFLAGLVLPIGQGLITDQRRTVLRQAELLGDLAEAEQIKVINKLLLEATKEYWNWYYAFESLKFISQAAHLTQNIFNRIKTNYQLGEASQMDTVQAFITWQTRLIEWNEAKLALQNIQLTLSNFLWDEANNPIQLNPSVIPSPPSALETITNNEADHLIELAKANHPELSKQQIKIRQYEMDKRLAREFLKPKLDFNYFLLSQPGTVSAFDPLNDYKLGLDFSFPLFLRKERSKIALTDLKIRNATFDLDLQKRNILNETQSAINEINTKGTLIQQQQVMVNSYDQLMQAELLNLENGESDLFKINIQQEKLVQSQLKLLKLKTEFAKQRYYVMWAAGVKNLEF